MHCKRCSSADLRHGLTAEIAIHFPGLAGLHKPIVWVFPTIAVCLQCGFAEFIVPEKELKVLETGENIEGVAAD